MKVYPASKHRDQCTEAVARLLARGHEVTHNWAVGTKRTYSDADAAIAAEDIEGIVRAQVLLLLWSSGMRAAFTELGVAIALHRRIILVGCEDPNENVFFRLPQVVRVGTLSEALDLLDTWAAQE